MAWNNASENGRYGPFSSGAQSTMSSGLGSSAGASAGSGTSTAQMAAADGMLPASSGGYALPGSGSNGSVSSTVNPTSTTQSAASPYLWNVAGQQWYSSIPQPADDVNNGAMGYAEGGGVLPTGNGTPDMAGALTSVRNALGAGRKAMGLPHPLTGSAQSFADGGEAEPLIPGAANPDEGLLEASRAQRAAAGRAQADRKSEQLGEAFQPGYDAGGDVDNPSNPANVQAQSYSFDAGGVVPDGGNMDDPTAAGMPAQPQDNVAIPQQGQTQDVNNSMQALQQYVSGAGAVPPQVATAAEQQVDPTQSLDPSQRRLLAAASAPTPQAQFGMLQHYRQRYQALKSLAQVAAEGTQQRPASLAASTDAATRAFSNVPNGTSVHFHPAGPNNVAVMVTNHAGGGKKQRGYAAGGPVPDDIDTGPDLASGADIANELEATAGAAQNEDTDADSTMTQPADVSGVIPAVEDAVNGAAEQANPTDEPDLTQAGSAVKSMVLSVPQYLQMLKNVHFDHLMDQDPGGLISAAQNVQNLDQSTDAAMTETTDQSRQEKNAAGAVPSDKVYPKSQSTAPIQYGSAPGPQQAQQTRADEAAYQQMLQQDSQSGAPPSLDRVATEGGMINKLNAEEGAKPVSATIPGFDPRVMAQADALYTPGSPQWKQFAIAAQSGLVSGMNAQAMQNLKGQWQQRTWGTREGAINNRADQRNATTTKNAEIRNQGLLDRTRMMVAQRALASGNANVSSAVRAIMQNVPGTSYQDALKIVQQAASQPQQAAQPTGNQSLTDDGNSGDLNQSASPITGPIAVNPQTGQRMTVRNGQWVPLP